VRLLTSFVAIVVGGLTSCGPPPPPLPPAQPAARAEPAREHAGPAAHPGPAEQAGHHGHHSAHSSPTSNHRFDDPERWAKVFDDPERDAWQKPDDVLGQLSLQPDDVVVDLGAGTGYFAMRIAPKVPRGKVLAVDVEEKLVAYMKERADKHGVGNLETVLATTDDPKLPDGVSLVLVVDTYHHIGDRSAYFGRVRKKLGPSGRVVIVDFKKGDFPVGPPDAHKLAPDLVESEMKVAGFRMCKSWDGLPYQYLLVFAEKC
jgi:ubiquinone/menaquinone biosynthesis C-methylase UbiE